MKQVVARSGRVFRRALDWVRWRGEIRTVLRGRGKGLRIHAHNASANYAEGVNELPVQDAIATLLDPGDVFFDIGANVGFFSLIAARSVGPSGRVVAFEAVPEIATTITENADLNGISNVDVRAVAIGAEPGRALLHVTNHPGGATIAAHADAADVNATVETEVVSIDSLITGGHVAVPDCVKIDVEGHELETLSGMQGLLAAHHPTLVVEIDAATVERLETKRTEIEGLLTGFGYSVEPLPKSYIGTDWQVIHLVATGT